MSDEDLLPAAFPFQDYFWDTQGYQSLVAKLDTSADQLKRVIDHYKARAEAEAQYAQVLDGITQDHELKCDSGTLLTVIEKMNSGAITQVRLHAQLSVKITETVVAPLEAFYDTQRELKKKIEFEWDRVNSKVESEHIYLTKVTKDYQSRIEKIKKTSRKKTEIEDIEKKYQIALANYNQSLETRDDKIVRIAKSVQKSENSRIGLLKKCFASIATSQQQLLGSLTLKLFEAIAKTVDSIDATKDNNLFVSLHANGSEKPPVSESLPALAYSLETSEGSIERMNSANSDGKTSKNSGNGNFAGRLLTKFMKGFKSNDEISKIEEFNSKGSLVSHGSMPNLVPHESTGEIVSVKSSNENVTAALIAEIMSANMSSVPSASSDGFTQSAAISTGTSQDPISINQERNISWVETPFSNWNAGSQELNRKPSLRTQHSFTKDSRNEPPSPTGTHSSTAAQVFESVPNKSVLRVSDNSFAPKISNSSAEPKRRPSYGSIDTVTPLPNAQKEKSSPSKDSEKTVSKVYSPRDSRFDDFEEVLVIDPTPNDSILDNVDEIPPPSRDAPKLPISLSSPLMPTQAAESPLKPVVASSLISNPTSPSSSDVRKSHAFSLIDPKVDLDAFVDEMDKFIEDLSQISFVPEPENPKTRVSRGSLGGHSTTLSKKTALLNEITSPTSPRSEMYIPPYNPFKTSRRTIKMEGWAEVAEDYRPQFQRKWCVLEGGCIWIFESPNQNIRLQDSKSNPITMIGLSKVSVQIGRNAITDWRPRGTATLKHEFSVITQPKKSILMCVDTKDELWQV